MRARYAAAIAAAVLTAGAPHALAAAKPACLLVTDEAGDGTPGFGALPSRDALDILSADVATGRRNLVAVLRLASTADDPTLTTGVTYALGWSARGIRQQVSLVRYSNGDVVASFDANTAGPAGDGAIDVVAVVDQATSTITWTVPRKADPALNARGAKLGAFTATAHPVFNLSGEPAVQFSGSADVLGGDDAESGKTYTDLQPSCVKGV